MLDVSSAMKATILFSAALVSAAAVPSTEPTSLDAEVFKYFQRDANGVNGESVRLGSNNHQGMDLQEVKIRYGPYNIPANDVREPQTASTIGIGREKGGLTNVPTSNIAKPCSECLITKIQAGLENADGDDLNVDTGLMLHHMVLMNGGKNKRDATCGKKFISLPQSAVFASGRSTERFFSSGNERTVVNFVADGRKVGYKVNKNDKFSLLTDLMNMNDRAKKVWVTVSYEWIALQNATEFNQVKPIWLDYDNCGTSDVTFPTKLEQFKLTAQPWTSDFNGDLVLGIGHLHDGGTHLNVKINDKLICNAKMLYGTTPRYVEMSAFRTKLKMNQTMMPYKQKRDDETHLEVTEKNTDEGSLVRAGSSLVSNLKTRFGIESIPGASFLTDLKNRLRSTTTARLFRREYNYKSEQGIDEHHLQAEAPEDRAQPGMLHISQATQCTDMGSFKKGDKFTVAGFYDMKQHAVMKDDNGKPKNLMAIALLWAEVPLNFNYAAWQRPPLPSLPTLPSLSSLPSLPIKLPTIHIKSNQRTHS